MNSLNDRPNSRPPSDKIWLRGLGMGVCAGGGAFLGSSLVRKIRAEPGQTLCEWMKIGGIANVIGFFIARSLRPRGG